MKNRITAFAMATGICLAALNPARAQTEEKADELDLRLSQTWESLKAFTIEQKDALAAESNDLLAALDARIDDAQAAAASAGDDAKEEWNEMVADLSDYREDVAAGFDTLQDSSAEAWDDAKLKLSETLESLQQSLQDEETPAE